MILATPTCYIFINIQKLIMKEVIYKEIKDTLKDLDLVLFRGGEFVSNAIAWLEAFAIHRPNITDYVIAPDAFTHCGIVLSRELVDDDRLDPDKLYIFESTMSGPLNDNVLNIDGKAFLGVQIRELDSVVTEYNASPGTRVAFAHLNRRLLHDVWGDSQETLSTQLTDLVHRYEGVRYDANPISLISTIFNLFRICRRVAENLAGTEDWLFCSELVAVIYKALGLFPASVEPKNVVPMDFIGYEQDCVCESGIPVIVNEPFYVVTS